MKRKLWPVLLAATLGFAVLVSLGVWQVQRLALKNALIAEIDRNLAAVPVSLEDALKQVVDGKHPQGLKVKATGAFMPRTVLRKLATHNSGPAFDLIKGFKSTGGAIVLVKLGKLQEGQQVPAAADTPIDVAGILVWHDQGRGRFDPDNRPDLNLWHWWDVPAMAQQLGIVEPSLGLVVELLPGSPGTEGLVVDPPKANLRNNHLGYAITWFGLAGVLAVMAVIFIVQLKRK